MIPPISVAADDTPVQSSLVHTIGAHISYLHGGTELFRYVYNSTVPAAESPRPYFHPLRTLSGRPMTIFRPNDHRWHTGLTFAFADVSGESFWGGKSYVHPDGYQWLDNLGSQRHAEWESVSTGERPAANQPADDQPGMVERLSWVTHEDTKWIDERREIRVLRVDEARSAWCLGFCTTLTNVAGRALVFGSPTTAGRPEAGYGGLFWRGLREFSTGTPLTSTGVTDAQEAMGCRAEWAAYHCPFDGDDSWATIVFADSPSNPRHPTQWFVRRMPGYPALGCAFVYDQTYELRPEVDLSLSYRVLIMDGKRDGDEIRELLAAAGPMPA